jgi:protein SCO1/2
MRTHRSVVRSAAFRPFGAWRIAVSFSVVATLASIAGLSGCSKPSKSEAAPADPKEKRFPIVGEIVAVHADRQTLDVHHEAIKDYMPSMTMEFKVSSGDVANAQPGQRIRAELVYGGNGELKLEKIWTMNAADAAKIEAAEKALTQDTVILGNNAFREVGEKIPEFALYDQDGRVVESSRFRGKQLLVNFIYTRCPIATMCPASTAKFQQTQKAARAAGINNLELVSISLDPEHDTPGVLKEYALQRSIDTSNFTFLTGPQAAIKNLLAQFGVIAEFEGDLIKHTLATVLIDENGKIIWRADNSSWDVQEFLGKMKR